MTTTKKTDITTTDKGQSDLPAYLQEFTGNVNEDNFDLDDVAIPRVKLLQGLSKEVETFDTARSGNFWHTGLDIDLGPEIQFIVADRRKKYLLAAPLADGQGILARADDAKTWNTLGKWEVKVKGVKQPVTWEITNLDVDKSGLTDWGTSVTGDEDSPPAATLFYDYLIYLPDHPDMGMAVLSLARSQIKPARKGLNDKIKMHGDNGRPMQSLIFKAKSIEETGEEGAYKNFSFQSGGYVTDKALFDQMREHRGALSNLKIKDEADTDQKDPESADDGSGNF
jgi:hypothetical protein